MYGLFTPVFIFQIFCLYHAYRRNAEQRWYWLILFFPLGGCIIYLVHNFGSAPNLEKIGETVKGVVINNYRIVELERALVHSDTITNRTNLADEYRNVGRYDDAIRLYRESLTGFMADDPTLQLRLIKVYFLKQEFEPIIPLGEALQRERGFHLTEEKAAYAWALHRCGRTEEARHTFESMDRPYTNHKQRLEYCKFLIELAEYDNVMPRLDEIIAEFNVMKGRERKLYSEILHEVKDLRYFVSQTAMKQRS